MFLQYLFSYINIYLNTVQHVSDIKQVLQDRFNEMLSAANAKDMDTVGTIYKDDAVMAGPEGMPVNGSQGILNFDHVSLKSFITFSLTCYSKFFHFIFITIFKTSSLV